MFITEIPLKTTSSDESTILTRYEAGRQLLNACIGECLRRLNLMRQSKEFHRVKALPKQKEKQKLQRKLDRSRRAMNPDNFNENGTAKKGYRKWNKSNHYIQTSNDIAKTDRKLAAYRFGKTISVRAPSMFMSSLKRKAENAGGYLKEFPTQTTKLSQTCHICGEAVKKPLSQRWHECCGIRMQRDLYSAFLSKSVDVGTISRVNQTASGRIFPASFGFNRIQSQSSSSVNPISNATKNLDVVIRISEDESQIEVA